MLYVKNYSSTSPVIHQTKMMMNTVTETDDYVGSFAGEQNVLYKIHTLQIHAELGDGGTEEVIYLPNDVYKFIFVWVDMANSYVANSSHTYPACFKDGTSYVYPIVIKKEAGNIEVHLYHSPNWAGYNFWGVLRMCTMKQS